MPCEYPAYRYRDARLLYRRRGIAKLHCGITEGMPGRDSGAQFEASPLGQSGSVELEATFEDRYGTVDGLGFQPREPFSTDKFLASPAEPRIPVKP